MKQLLLLLLASCITAVASAQFKKDGTPDMRYKANKQMYGTQSSYSAPKSNFHQTSFYQSDYKSTTNSNRNYKSSGQLRVQKGYMKRNGTYVQPHLKTSPDNYRYNNLKIK